MKQLEILFNNALEQLDDDLQNFVDFDCDYISDQISSMASESVPMFYNDLIKWAADDPEAQEAIENSVAEFGFPTDTNNFDLMKLYSQGYYYNTEQKFYKNKKTCLLCWCWSYIWKDLKIQEITEEQQETIENLSFDDFDKFDEIRDQIKHILGLTE